MWNTNWTVEAVVVIVDIKLDAIVVVGIVVDVQHNHI
jgi:hypothetical protein